MKYFLATLTVLLLTASTGLYATVIYVAPAAPASATGAGWHDPTNLTTALARAQPGDRVFCHTGVYFPGATRNSSFVVPAGVAVYGGFTGHEADPQERDASLKSVLSGDIGQRNTADDNVYTVVRLRSGEINRSTLDGFVIRDGVGRGFSDGYAAKNAGGGLYVEAPSAGTAAHEITNCVFLNNHAHNGGAVFVNAAQPVFSDCRFTGNRADFNGGAVYNQGAGSSVTPVFRDCEFSDNTSNSGAGMTNNGTSGEANVLLIACHFADNFSLIKGAAIFNITAGGRGLAEVVVDGCTFVGNDSVLRSDNVSGSGTTAGSRSAAPRRNAGGRIRPAAAVKR